MFSLSYITLTNYYSSLNTSRIYDYTRTYSYEKIRVQVLFKLDTIFSIA